LIDISAVTLLAAKQTAEIIIRGVLLWQPKKRNTPKNQDAEVRQDGEDRGGHLRHGVQGSQPRHHGDSGPEAGETGRGRRGCAQLRPPGDLPAEGESVTGLGHDLIYPNLTTRRS